MAILSKLFFTEYMMRNSANFNEHFEPVLEFQEFLNLIFVASNFAFGSGIYL